MQPKLLKDTLVSLAKVRRPVLIEGPPGLGKTQLVQQIAKDFAASGDDYGFVQLHAPLMQPEDFGMPIVNAARDGITFAVPEKFPMVGNDGHPERGIVLIDELPQADNSGQKILANLIQERELHGRKLKPGWTIMATGNRQEDRAGANRILSHLRNRVTTLEFEPHLDDWCDWALANNVNPAVVAFLRWRPDLLSKVEKHNDIYPTPRGWVEGVSNVVGTVPETAEFECFKGAVGEGATGEYVGFLQIYRKLPDPDLVLADPDRHQVPDDLSTLYALAGAIAHRATPENFANVVKFADRMPPEFMTLVIRDAVKRHPVVTTTEAFRNWTLNGGQILV